MDEGKYEPKNLQQKSHEALLKILNNIGVVGSIIAGVADIIFVIIFILGVNIQAETNSIVIFSVINSVIGVLINVLLRYQGQKYAEIENADICSKFYRKKAKKKRKHLSMTWWQVINGFLDVILKGATAAFSIFGIIYISIEGSKNPIQILITLVTLVLFACFGLVNMNSAYTRFYNVQLPYMENKIMEIE